MADENLAKNIEGGQLEKPAVSAQPEKEISPENVLERTLETPTIEKAETVKPVEQTGEAAPVVAPAVKTLAELRAAQIDQILSEDLEATFLSLPKDKQMEFKKAGEETAHKIYQLLEKTKTSLKKIIHLIRRWLALIPGVNKFFLEQESKIKADKIIALKK